MDKAVHHYNIEMTSENALKELIVSIYENWNHKISEFNKNITTSNAQLSIIIILYCTFLDELRQFFYHSTIPYNTSETSSYKFIILFQFTKRVISQIIYSGLINFLQYNIQDLINSHQFQSHVEYQPELKIFVVQHENLKRYAILIQKTFNNVFHQKVLQLSYELCVQFFLFLPRR
ncbi:uncharacterized protein LOC127283810 [Leptopilina boulardi]|uniref:uncharacterized protein LOC127283810 n=1 Tax=Leptopilina boulardi TaxID=63433 RepID=UPI0021F63677|nr:uncharacterized protein LOC127283810 [Leptopilina boulardi]